MKTNDIIFDEDDATGQLSDAIFKSQAALDKWERDHLSKQTAQTPVENVAAPVQSALNLLSRNGGANIPPEQIPMPVKLWCNAHSAKLQRITSRMNRGLPCSEDYSGYDQDLFEYYGCRVFDT